MKVARLKNVQVEDFVGQHVHFLLLQVGQFLLQVDALFLLDARGNLFPLLFKFQALVVIFDTPFLASLFNFFGSVTSRRSLFWLGRCVIG